MDVDEARDIVSVLANGTDPTTGEVLPESSPYNNPKVIRALFAMLRVTETQKKPKKTIEQKQLENIKTGRPRNSGLGWADELKQQLAARFRDGASIDQLAAHFERTTGAILAELVKQGLIEQEAVSDSR